MRRLSSAAVLLFLIGFLVWAFLPRPVEVELAEVAPRMLEIVVEEEGEARIRDVFTVSATMAGKLQRISLHAGDNVTKGETIVALIGPAAPVLLDSRSRSVATAAAAAAQAAMELAQAQLAQAEAAHEFMLSEANRAISLYEKGAISQRAYDSAIRERKTSQAAVRNAGPAGHREWPQGRGGRAALRFLFVRRFHSGVQEAARQDAHLVAARAVFKISTSHP